MSETRIVVLRRIVSEHQAEKLLVSPDSTVKTLKCTCIGDPYSILEIEGFTVSEQYPFEKKKRKYRIFLSDNENYLLTKKQFESCFRIDKAPTPEYSLVDVQTANLLVQIYDAFQEEKHRQMFNTMNLGQLIKFAWNQVK